MGAYRWERRLPRSARWVSHPTSRLTTADRYTPSRRRDLSRSRQETFRSIGCGALWADGANVARKLKSDQVLFIATLLLVCASIVMVYSASAVVALERFDQPYFFLTKQALWAVLGLAVLAIAMRIDYRTYRNDAFIWGALALVVLMLVARAVQRAGQRDPPLVQPRRPRHPAVGAGEDRRDPVHRADPRAPDAPDRRSPVFAAADRHRRRRDVRADPAPARLRHGDVAAADRRPDGVRRRPELPVSRRRRARRAAGAVHRADERDRTAAAGCSRSGTPGRIRSATASR